MRCRHQKSALCGLAGLLIACGLSAAEPEPAANGGNAGSSIESLVEQLGDDSYRVRERATAELGKIGLPARQALEAGLKHRDAEIRLRCQRVLTVVMERDYQARLNAFESDREGKNDHQLPAWSRFRDLVGADQTARSLFVEMHRAEPTVMLAAETAATSPRRSAEVLLSRSLEVQQALFNPQFGERRQPSLGSLTALFYLAGLSEVDVSDEAGNYLSNLANQGNIQTTMNGGGAKADALRKVLGSWVGRKLTGNSAFQTMILALRYELREAVLPAVELCQQQNGMPQTLQYAALVVGKFGGKEHLSAVEPLLNNNTICMNHQINNQQYKAEVRDVALAVLVHLAGLEFKEYGFDRIEKNPMFLFNPASLGFKEPFDRQPGIKKWQAWHEAQKEKKTEKPDAAS